MPLKYIINKVFTVLALSFFSNKLNAQCYIGNGMPVVGLEHVVVSTSDIVGNSHDGIPFFLNSKNSIHVTDSNLFTVKGEIRVGDEKIAFTDFIKRVSKKNKDTRGANSQTALMAKETEAAKPGKPNSKFSFKAQPLSGDRPFSFFGNKRHLALLIPVKQQIKKRQTRASISFLEVDFSALTLKTAKNLTPKNLGYTFLKVHRCSVRPPPC